MRPIARPAIKPKSEGTFQIVASFPVNLILSSHSEFEITRSAKYM